jgi:cytoskeleton protein RodZ
MSPDESATPVSGGGRRPGEILRAERERQSLGVADVAARLRLSVRQIEAIEAGDYDSLPGKAFVRGFLRNYAKLLRLDQDSVLSAATEAGALDGGATLIRAPDQNIRFTSSEAVSNRKLFLGTAAIGAVLAVTAAAWRWESGLGDLAQRARAGLHAPTAAGGGAPATPTPGVSGEGGTGSPANAVADASPSAATAPVQEAPGSVARPSERVPADRPGAVSPSAATPVPGASPVASSSAMPATVVAPASPAAGATAPVSEPSAAGGANHITLSFSGESWVEMRDGAGKKIYAKLNAPGTVEQIDVRPPVSLVIGNARDVKVSFNGQDVDLSPHIRVSVARLTLDN